MLQNPIFKRFAALTSGGVLGQVMMVIALPVLTRLYAPADFGLLGTFSSVVMLVLPAACLRFDLAIPIASDDHDARALMLLGFISASVIAVLVWLLLGPLGSVLDQDFVLLFDKYDWLVALTLWSAAVFSLTQFWAIRCNLFSRLALSHVSRGFMGASSQVGLGFAGAGGFGLLLGQGIYMGLGGVSLATSFLRAELRNLRTLTAAFAYNTAKRYWRFPVFSTPEALLDTAGMHLPLLIVAALSGPEMAGMLFLAQRLTSIPVGVIGGSLSRVYIGEAPKQFANGNLHLFTLKLWRSLFFIGLGPMLLGMIYAPLLTERILGSEWFSASGFIVLLLPPAFLQACVVPISTAFHVLKKHALATGLKAVGLIFQVTSILTAYSVGLKDPVVGLSVGITAYYFLFTIIVLNTTRKA
jgi:O-antigen/teichoic acid export membrane protein